jgi:hypothetical protein
VARLRGDREFGPAPRKQADDVIRMNSWKEGNTS